MRCNFQRPYHFTYLVKVIFHMLTSCYLVPLDHFLLSYQRLLCAFQSLESEFGYFHLEIFIPSLEMFIKIHLTSYRYVFSIHVVYKLEFLQKCRSFIAFIHLNGQLAILPVQAGPIC